MDKQYNYELYLNGKLIHKFNTNQLIKDYVLVNNKSYKVISQSTPFAITSFVRLVMCNVKELNECKCRWECSSDDGSFTDDSRRTFDTQEECYNDMRNSALEKMKWNTEWCDVNDCADGDFIGYKVSFFKDKIIHKSYSGTYTYIIKKIENDE